MSYVAPAIALAACVGLAGCTTSEGRSIMEHNASETTQDGVDFAARVSRESSGGLRVQYTLHNRTGVTLGVFNRVVATSADGSQDLVLRHAYVALEGENLLVRAIELPPLGHGIQTTAQVSPYVSRVLPSQTFTDTFFLPEPVVVDDPNRLIELSAASATDGAEIKPTARRRASTVVLSVGIFRVENGVTLRPVSWPGTEGVFRPYPFTYKQVVLSARVPLAQPIAVMDYQPVGRAP